MSRLEELTRRAFVRGIFTTETVLVFDVAWHGANVVEQTYEYQSGRLGNELIYRDREPIREVIDSAACGARGRDGALFRLV